MATAELELTEIPFSTTPTPRFFYLAPQYRAAGNHVASTIKRKEGLAILAGPVGCGKTTMVRFLAEHLVADLGDARDGGGLRWAYLPNPSYSSDMQFLKAICKEFGLATKTKKLDQLDVLVEFLKAEYAQDRTVAIFVDEAHKLAGPALELVRELFNYAHNEHFYMQVVLAGEAGPLQHKLKNKKAILSRAMFYDVLEPLSLEDTAALVRYRLAAASWPEDLFTEEAIEKLWKVSGGLPRTIIKIGRLAFAHRGEAPEVVDVALIDEVLRENPRVVTHV